MPAFMFLEAQRAQDAGTLDLDSDTLKLMLVTAGYTASKNDTSVATAAASEIVATGYTGGFGGSGRKVVALTITKDTTAGVNRIIFPATVTWANIGGATNATLAGAVLIKEVSNDGSSLPVVWFPLLPFTTNGSGFQLSFDTTSGNLTYSV
jgi:hypothetical protein